MSDCHDWGPCADSGSSQGEWRKSRPFRRRRNESGRKYFPRSEPVAVGGKSNSLRVLSARKQYRSTRLDSILTRSETVDALRCTDKARAMGRVTHQVGHVTCSLTFPLRSGKYISA
jgi:hypothetical protein